MRGGPTRRIGIIAVLVASLLMVPVAPVGPASVPAPVAPATVEAGALPPGARAVVGLVKLFAARNARNRVYREARRTQADLDAYYDGLRDTARAQLTQFDRKVVARTRAGTYVKLVKTIEAEREMATVLIESEKNDARLQFNRTLSRELLGALVRSPAAGKIIRQLRSRIDEMRQALQQVKAAIEGGNPVDAAMQRFLSKVPPIPELQQLAVEISGKAYEELDRVTGGVLSIDGALRAEGVAAIDALGGTLESADGRLARLDQLRKPMSHADFNAQLGRVLAPEPGVEDVPLEVAADAIGKNVARKIVAQLDEVKFRRMKDRIKAELLKQRLERLDKPEVEIDEKTICRRVGAGEFQKALATLGRAGEWQAPSSEAEEPFYFVCYQGEIPIAAWIIDDEDKEEATEEDDEEDDADDPPIIAPDLPPIIPPGTYVGMFDEADYEYWSLAEVGRVTTNSIEITVKPDGAVVGEFAISLDGSLLGCVVDEDDRGSIAAKAELGPSEPVQVALLYHYRTYHRSGPIGPGGYEDCFTVERDEGDVIAELVFSEEGGEMTGHIGFEGTAYYTFTASLQG